MLVLRLLGAEALQPVPETGLPGTPAMAAGIEGAHLQQVLRGGKVRWEPLARQPKRLAYIDPVVTVHKGGKLHITMEAERLLGMPDEIVILRNGDGKVAIRTSRRGDSVEHRRKLDPNGNMSIATSVLAPGAYLLKPHKGLFVLVSADAKTLRRKMTAESRKDLAKGE